MKRRGAGRSPCRSKPAVVQGEIWRETPPLNLLGVQSVAQQRQILERRGPSLRIDPALSMTPAFCNYRRTHPPYEHIFFVILSALYDRGITTSVFSNSTLSDSPVSTSSLQLLRFTNLIACTSLHALHFTSYASLCSLRPVLFIASPWDCHDPRQVYIVGDSPSVIASCFMIHPLSYQILSPQLNTFKGHRS